ncbi:hypothetical protein HY029_05300 [Candidatus Gottesmanbacteria bacterium]|nr:hypothetical protein [Candidatus Gottesmanbacteria bacterium]
MKYTKDQTEILTNLGKLLDADSQQTIQEELEITDKNQKEKLFKRIQKNLKYLTTIKQRGDYYHKIIITRHPNYLQEYSSLLHWLDKRPYKFDRQHVPHLDIVNLKDDIDRIILLGDGHVFGPEFTSAVYGGNNNLPELLLDIVSDAQSVINGNGIQIITPDSPKYKDSLLLKFIQGEAMIIQTGDNIYPSILEDFVLMSLRVIGKYFYSLSGDNDAFLVIESAKLPSVSDRIAAQIMRSAVMKQISQSQELFQVIQREVASRSSALLIKSKEEALGFSHAGIYDISFKKEKDEKFSTRQEMRNLGIIDQDIEKTENYLLELSHSLNLDIIGWMHGSESSEELRKIANIREITPGIFTLHDKRVWIADNKQDPDEATRSILLDVKNGLKEIYQQLLEYKTSTKSLVQILP